MNYFQYLILLNSIVTRNDIPCNWLDNFKHRILLYKSFNLIPCLPMCKLEVITRRNEKHLARHSLEQLHGLIHSCKPKTLVLLWKYYNIQSEEISCPTSNSAQFNTNLLKQNCWKFVFSKSSKLLGLFCRIMTNWICTNIWHITIVVTCFISLPMLKISWF